MGQCGDETCSVSSGICGAITFGRGELDDYGYWEEPCGVCARAWEDDHPGQFAWPRKRILWFDNCEYWAEDFYHQQVDGKLVPLFPIRGPAAERFQKKPNHTFHIFKPHFDAVTGQCYAY